MVDYHILDYEFAEGEVYLAAVTYARSSMAMLDMMQKRGVKPVVCFINYHTGESIEDAQERLEHYCDVRDLPFEACDTNLSDQTGRKENYTEWCRKVRYDFFEKIYKKYNAAGLFVSHTQDEILEDYLLTKKYGIDSAHYGQGKISSFRDMLIIRPFIDHTRAELARYDDENGVPYSMHRTSINSENFHEKTEIKAEVEQLNELQRNALLDEIRARTDQEHNLHKSIMKSIEKQFFLEIRPLMALNKNDFYSTLIDFVKAKSPVKFTLTKEKISAIREMCIDGKEIEALQLKGKIYMVKEYDILYLDDDGLNMPYSYTLDKPQVFESEIIDLDFTMGAEDRNVHEDDYPITIRSCLPQDIYVFDEYAEPVRKMLREVGLDDEFIPLWPVILNKNGKIIYVPRYRKTIERTHTSIFRIKLIKK